MSALKRVIAYAVDLVLIAAPSALLMEFAQDLAPARVVASLPSMVRWGVGIVVPVLILGVFTGLFGWTPGKLIMFLRVRDHNGEPPGIAQGILREGAKALALGFFFGMLYAARDVLSGSRTFYDNWLGLDVDDIRPVGLTETQKNWRRYQREQAKKARRA